ncbi:MAG: carboxylate-amine ligase [Paracoccaceae bacterium]|nr:carboxylate-amine ligase [Paracoccaceae bacterium]
MTDVEPVPDFGLTLGIEEEYLIVDRDTRDLVREPDPGFMEACSARVGNQVTNEYLQCQVEIGTPPVADIAGARESLIGLRRAVADAAAEFGYAPIAASTHPFARWRDQTHTRKDRYDALRSDLGQTIRRMMICGMHVHLGIENPDLRVDVMNQVTYFLPHLLALSCSSPFWEGEDTSLASYRLAVFGSLPRSGLPDLLTSWAEYQRLVDQLVGAGCLEDASKIWWDIRPSSKFPTLEQRITDVCSRLDDALCVAATYQSLVSFLFVLRANNQRWRQYPTTLIEENRWRGQRYGVRGQMVDHGKAILVPFGDLAEELIGLLGPSARALDCENELLHIRTIINGGTSADRQREAARKARENGATGEEAMRTVVDHLIGEFLEGAEPGA